MPALISANSMPTWSLSSDPAKCSQRLMRLPCLGLYSSTGQHHFDPVSRISQLGRPSSMKRPTRLASP